jgi:hypothetical protein
VNKRRQRETEEQDKREALTKAQTNKAMTDQAARLDGQIATVNARLDKAPAVVTADPQASTFSQLTGFSVDTSAVLYAFLFSIALETAAMFAMMVAYSSPKVPISSPPIATPTEIEVEEPSHPRPVPRLVTSNPPAMSVIEFAARRPRACSRWRARVR